MKATAQGQQQSSEDPNDIVTIVSHKTFNEEDSGITAIIGEVRNDSPNTIGGVLIRGKFYGSNGQLIHLGDGNTRLSALRPGEKIPFLIPINDASISRSIANYIPGPEIQLSFVINKIT
jgi:hypothetical protein